MKGRGALVVALTGALCATAPPASAQSPFDLLDPADTPLAYCPGSPGGAAGEVTTDAEHGRIVPDQPLPPGVAERKLTAAGVESVVLEAGPRDAGDAVLFVHGNPGSSRDFADLVAAAGTLGRAVAIDVPGFGRAGDGPELQYGTDAAAHFLDTALGQLGVRRAHLVLHDFGGPWGLQWAAAHGDVVDSVALINTGVLIGYYGHAAAHVWHTPAAGEAFMAATTRDVFRAFLQSNNPKPLPAEFVDRMYDDFDRATRCAVLAYYRDVDDPDGMGRAQAAALRKRERPALVVWGEQDPFLPPELAERQREAFPAAEIHMLPDAGHWPFVDEPERVRTLLTGFLRRVLPAPAPAPSTAPARLRVTPRRVRRGARSLSVRVTVLGAANAIGVRVRLHRGGAAGPVVASSGAGRRVAGVATLRLRLRARTLRRGRWTIVARADGIPAARATLRVR